MWYRSTESQGKKRKRTKAANLRFLRFLWPKIRIYHKHEKFQKGNKVSSQNFISLADT